MDTWVDGGVWKAHVWKAVYGRCGRRIYRVDALKVVNIKAGVSTKAPPFEFHSSLLQASHLTHLLFDVFAFGA